MIQMVHLCDERIQEKIRKNGIKKSKKGVYAMPVLPNFFVSHQWLRELKRSGVRNIVGVYFKIPDDLMVLVGRYGKEHLKLRAADMVATFMQDEDALGYECILPEKILPSQITKIRSLPQTLGWRYFPDSHNRKPCGCPACMSRGEIKSRKIREEYAALDGEVESNFNHLKSAFFQAETYDELETVLYGFRRKTRKADPSFLQQLLADKDPDIRYLVAEVLGYFRHPNTKNLLDILLKDSDEEVVSAAKESYALRYKIIP
jgi:HEAT repeats